MRQSLRRILAFLAVLFLTLGLALPEKTLLPSAEAEKQGQTELQLLLGKSKKKKKTTATPAATATPAPEEADEETEEEQGPIIEPQAIADYLFVYGELPDNFITKKEAQELGWDSYRNYVSDVAPGMSIGGDRFGNYEGLLPKAKGRQYYECDCFYTEGKRNAYRIIFSNDGLVFYTEDHYQTFEEMHPSVPGTTRAP